MRKIAILPLLRKTYKKKSHAETRRGHREKISAPSASLREIAVQAVKELPQPQPPVAFGLLKVKPLPWKVDT